MGDVKVDVAVGPVAQHGEGPLWDAETGRLWWVDITGQAVHCFDPGTGADQAWATPWQPGGVVIDSHGRPLIAAPDGLTLLDPDTGQTCLSIEVENDRPENRANDVKTDARGRCWLGTMAFDKRAGNAALYRIEAGHVTLAVDGLSISNGPAIDESRGRLYLADTPLFRVDVFDVDAETGDLSGRRPFLDLSDAEFWPDGMTVDDEGMLWVACGRAGAVQRYRDDGILDTVISIPTSNPTSVAFGGVDGGDLYITTSWFDLEPERRADEPLAGALFRCRPGVTGRTAPRYLPNADDEKGPS